MHERCFNTAEPPWCFSTVSLDPALPPCNVTRSDRRVESKGGRARNLDSVNKQQGGGDARAMLLHGRASLVLQHCVPGSGPASLQRHTQRSPCEVQGSQGRRFGFCKQATGGPERTSGASTRPSLPGASALCPWIRPCLPVASHAAISA